MDDYNCITANESIDEIGMNGFRELRQLIKWLENPPTKWYKCRSKRISIRKNFSFRYAPSIISRCEAEVFNLSIPRFAIRVYPKRTEVPPNLNHNIIDCKVGYINLRRVETFRKYARFWSRKYEISGDYQLDTDRFSIQPSKVLEDLDRERKISRIGDCLLARPNWAVDFYVIQSNLGQILGETSKDTADFKGVPYMKHIILVGGGLCAQAVCFIGTTLMHKYALGVHGIGDITKLARKNVGSMLSLHGLNKSEMSRYFSHKKVGLRGDWQVFIGWSDKTTAYHVFSRTTQAYLLSNIPVICPIDLGRASGNIEFTSPGLKNTDILKTNGFKVPKLEPKRYNHAIILIGCGNQEDTTDMVLYHDTAVRPFMRATLDQLYEARCYVSEKREKLREACILAITPSRVKLHLNHWQKWNESGNKYEQLPGLIFIACLIQSGCCSNKVPMSSTFNYDPGSFRLIHLRWPVHKDLEDESNHTREMFCSMLGAIEGKNAYTAFLRYLDLKSSNHMELDRWIWIQHQKDCYDYNTKKKIETLWFWDAENASDDTDVPAGMSIYSPGRMMSFLLGVFSRTASGQWQSIDACCRFEELDIQLNVSLISSFSTCGIKDAVLNWPSSPPQQYCDLYTVMQKDASFYREKFNISQEINSRGLFAELQDTDGAIGFVANIVNIQLKEKGIILRSLASFLPGLASNNEDEAQEAQKALIFLLELAGVLNVKYKHKIHALEFVAGSMIEGALPVLDKKTKKAFFAACLEIDSQAGICRLVERLGPIAREARERNLFLALEMEPGVHFLINDWDSIVSFCRVLESDTGKYAYDLLNHVGLNLDIAHWDLAGIEPGNIAATSNKSNSDLIRRHIVHCHISDHGRGHFADLPLETINSRQYFADWLTVIKELNNNKFSRTVALELEACKDEARVKSSLDVINNILFDLSKYPYKKLDVLVPPKASRSIPIISIFRKGKKIILSIIKK